MVNKGEDMEPVFSEEWIKLNPWMGEWYSEQKKVASICINFPQGVPLPKAEKRRKRRFDIHFKKAQDIALFNELMDASSHRISSLVRDE